MSSSIQLFAVWRLCCSTFPNSSKNTYFEVILKPLTFKRSIHFVLTSLLTSHFDFSHFLNSQLNDNRDSQNLSPPKIKTINAWYENAALYFSSTFIWLTRLVYNFTDSVLQVLRFMVVKILEVRCLPETSVNKLNWTYIVVYYVTESSHVTYSQKLTKIQRIAQNSLEHLKQLNYYKTKIFISF